MSFPTKTLTILDETVSVPHIRKKVRYREGVEYKLTMEDINQDKGNILANLAIKFYGDPNLFTIIQENNPPLNDLQMVDGLTLFIPSLAY